MLRVAIKPSRYLAVALAVVHAVAACVVLQCPFTWEIQLALGVFIAVSFAVNLRQHAWLSRVQSIVAVELAHDGVWTYCMRDGVWHEAKLLASTYVSPSATVLGLRKPGTWRARHVLLVRDNVDPDAFRRLRVALRWPRRGAGSADVLQF